MRSPAPHIAVVLALAAAAPATAEAAGRADRADARAFGRATATLRRAVLKEKGAIEAAARRLKRPRCARALDGVPAGQRGIDAAQLVFDYATQAMYEPLKQELAAFSARLDRIRVGDRRLRAGRAAFRRLAGHAQPLRPAPADVCGRLDAWRAAGYPDGGAPRIDDPAVYPFAVVSARDSVPLTRAGRRMKALGVAPRLYRTWTGEFGGLFDRIDLSPLDEPVGS
jgi:hypothetical protein